MSPSVDAPLLSAPPLPPPLSAHLLLFLFDSEPLQAATEATDQYDLQDGDGGTVESDVVVVLSVALTGGGFVFGGLFVLILFISFSTFVIFLATSSDVKAGV